MLSDSSRSEKGVADRSLFSLGIGMGAVDSSAMALFKGSYLCNIPTLRFSWFGYINARLHDVGCSRCVSGQNNCTLLYEYFILLSVTTIAALGVTSLAVGFRYGRLSALPAATTLSRRSTEGPEGSDDDAECQTDSDLSTVKAGAFEQCKMVAIIARCIARS